jgi:hypothetical protein
MANMVRDDYDMHDPWFDKDISLLLRVFWLGVSTLFGVCLGGAVVMFGLAWWYHMVTPFIEIGTFLSFVSLSTVISLRLWPVAHFIDALVRGAYANSR